VTHRKDANLKAIVCRANAYHLVDVQATSEFILRVQKPNGEVPWSEGDKTDPWDHVESAMGLAVGGFLDQAKKAYLWSCRFQEKDGSWWSEYLGGVPKEEAHKDPNMTAYLASGALHQYLMAGDRAFLKEIWPSVKRAVDFAVEMQEPEGTICWAKQRDGNIERRALLTGSSSIFFSLGCAIRIGAILGEARPDWEEARARLGDAIRHKENLFDRTKARFSMDWYYPILCGAVTGRAAEQRIQRYWDRFAVPGWGIRCVSDRSWVTMAETAELAITLAAMGWLDRAVEVFSWIRDKKYDDGSYWTGVTFPERTIFTQDKTAWTAAAVLLAADILEDLTPASQIFRHDSWSPRLATPLDRGGALERDPIGPWLRRSFERGVIREGPDLAPPEHP